MADVLKIPSRSEVAENDTWDLTFLFETDDAWDAGLRTLESKIDYYDSFKGRLGESAAVLAECLQFDSDFERDCDKLANYAYLKTTEDQTNSLYQGFISRYRNLATKAGEASSYIRPEILSLSQ